MKHAGKFNEPQSGRVLGRLFEVGSTLMIINTDGEARIVRRWPAEDLGDLVFREQATIAVNLDAVINAVNRRIGII